MKLSLIPAPCEISYLQGFTKCDAPVVRITDSSLPDEGFEICIDGEIRISASSESGFFYGENLVEQIKFQCGQNIPDVHIKDMPKYSYRSFMIDSCRHFVSVENIKRMIDHCAKLRLNVFHWHLTDDQGWRAEIRKYPELIEIGSIRFANNFGEEQNNDIHEGYYTQAQMREIVEYAHKNHMIVVPEIDMPGHVSALLASIPSLVCGDKKVEIKTSGGIFKDILCAGKDETYDILYDIFDEICAVFTDEYIHIGGDEAPKIQWKTCPDCQQKIKDEKLKNEEMLQGYFINRVKNYLSQKGKKVITWNESLKSGILDTDITVQMWMDKKGDCKKSDNPIIVSDFFHYYVDYPYTMTPLRKVYDYKTDINSNVIGVGTPIWTEYVPDIEYMEYMCFPRFIAVAQSAWSLNKPAYAQFRTELLELMGYYNIENAAEPEEWDPPVKTRLSGVVNHFGSIAPNEKVRNYFIKKKNKAKK